MKRPSNFHPHKRQRLKDLWIGTCLLARKITEDEEQARQGLKVRSLIKEKYIKNRFKWKNVKGFSTRKNLFKSI